MISYTVFIVDDEDSIRDGVSMSLEDTYRVAAFPDAESALAAIEKESPDLVLLDIGLPGMDGVEALRRIKERFPYILVIMITAYEDIDTVIAAMKLGAYDYVVKPLYMDGLAVTLENALETIRLRKEVQALQEKHLQEHIGCFIGESNAIQDVMDFVKRVAKSPDTPILITGETGTGKELIASAIHYNSPNFRAPLATVNCAAIPRELIESELFGYEKGAFSGAGATGKKGLIEESANGTLFLDEVGDLSLEAQAKLLRFLELGEFYRVGGTEKHYIKTRVISATNKNLDEMIEKGRFRKDLFFRLGVIKVQVPALDERSSDIIPLAKYFLDQFSRKFGKPLAGLSEEAGDALLNHSFTGHVRELKNLVERAVLVSDGKELSPDDLGLTDGRKSQAELAGGTGFVLPTLPPEGLDVVAYLRSIEAHIIRQALKAAKDNESKAAKLLRINHHTFRYRKKKLLGP
jgi:DNA-binding NtrC family response regulator